MTSSVGHGSRFRLCFPVDASPVDEPVRASVESEPELDADGQETILLVEDEDMVREMLKEMLMIHGYEVHVAEHGKEALQIYKEQGGQFDLVLTDVVMPMMNGRELADAILRISPNQSILYLSGYSDSDMLRHGLLESNSAFLQKPFRTETLLAKLREMLNKKSEGEVQ